VVIFLETAELRIKERKDITMRFWTENVDKILQFNDKPLLLTKGSVSNKQMEDKIDEIYNLFDKRRKEFEAIEADEEDLKALNQIENKLKNRK
jgi:hypothetical protein